MCPPRARAGALLTDVQHEMCQNLERHLRYFLSAGPLEGQSLGRCEEKFSQLLRTVKELPGVQPDITDVDLSELVCALQREIDPYGHRAQPDLTGVNPCKVPHPHLPPPSFVEGAAATAEPTWSPATRAQRVAGKGSEVDSPGSLGCLASGSSVAYKRVVADRIKWQCPPSFDPVPYLSDPLVKAIYLKPDTLRKPPETWPRLRPAHVNCSRRELLKLALKWDQVGALQIIRAEGVDESELVGLFAIPKDREVDRLIINPTTINSRCSGYSNFTKLLAPGALLTQLHLDDDQVARFSADDLTEMYYTFKVSPERAARNAIRMRFDAAEVSHFKCFHPLKHWGAVYLCLATLGMGDQMSVEVAQQSHWNVLAYHAGAMLPSEVLAYRRPFPRSPTIELLAIDDHVVCQKLTRQEAAECAVKRDSIIFDRSAEAYSSVGLVQHPKKRKRFLTEATVIGAEVNGDEGFVGPPRHRVAVLMMATLLLVRKGTCTPAVLSSVLGLWIHIVMFRRPALSLLNFAFRDARRLPLNRIIQLRRETLNELTALAMLAPVLQTDVRARYAPEVYSMDASPCGAGIASATVPPKIVSELWRHAEHRGFYTRLEGAATAVLREQGLESEAWFGEASARIPGPWMHVPPSLTEGVLYDVLEVFSPSFNWAAAHSALGLRSHPLSDSGAAPRRFEELLETGFWHELVALAARGVVREWHASPPSLSFSTLSRPKRRSRSHPFGFEPYEPNTRDHNTLARRLAMLMCIVARTGGFFSVAQPVASLMFRLHCFQSLTLCGSAYVRVHSEAYGLPFKRVTLWLHNKPWLHELSQAPPPKQPLSLLRVQGSCSKKTLETLQQLCKPSVSAVLGREAQVGEAVSSLASLLPRLLCQRLASGSLAASEGNVTPLPLSAQVEAASRYYDLQALKCEWLREVECSDRAFHDDPDWVGELADSLPFRERIRYKFARPSHINVLETRAYKTWLKHLCIHHQRSRAVGLIDSRVLLGAASKGRSSSDALGRVLRSSLPYVLGGALYPGGLHVYSAKNRADGPSRQRPVPPPSKDLPLWYLDLERDDTRRFDVCLASSRVPKNAARWLRMLLLMAGDIEPNPGPMQRPRGPLDLESGFAASTRHKMRKSLEGFASWLLSELQLTLLQVLHSAETAGTALRAYGMHLYEAGLPRYLLVYAITAVQDLRPQFRGALTPAWQIDKKWQLAEPGSCRPVISLPILQAAVAVAALWGWLDWASVTMLGFLCMLHPSEFVCLTRGDLVLPADAMSQDRLAYVHVRNPKTARFARRQHARLEDADTLAFLESRYGGRPLQERLFRGSLHTYRRQWNAIMQRLGVPHRQSDQGATPGVLRGSGATFLYLECEDVQLVAWRGRWAKLKTVEFYLQEVAASLLLQQLPPWARDRIATLRKYAHPLLRRAIQSESASSA